MSKHYFWSHNFHDLPESSIASRLTASDVLVKFVEGLLSAWFYNTQDKIKFYFVVLFVFCFYFIH